MSEVLNRVRDWLRRHAKDLIILLGIVGMSVAVRLATVRSLDVGGDPAKKWFFVRTWSYENHFDKWDHHMGRMGINGILYLVQKLFGTEALAYFIAPMAIATLQSVLAYLVARRLGTRFAGVLAALFIALFDQMEHAGGQINPEAFEGFYVILSFYFLLRYAEGVGRARVAWLVATGVSLFVLYLTKEPNVFFYPGFALAVWIISKRPRDVIILASVPAALFVVETALYAAFTQYELGRMQIVSGSYGKTGRLKPLTFFDLFDRYGSRADTSWKLALYPFFVSWPLLFWKRIHPRARLLLPVTFSFLFGITFYVRGINPIIMGTLFHDRYMSPIIPTMMLSLALPIEAVLFFLLEKAGTFGERARTIATRFSVLPALLVCAFAAIYMWETREPKKSNGISTTRDRWELFNRAYAAGVPIVAKRVRSYEFKVPFVIERILISDENLLQPDGTLRTNVYERVNVGGSSYLYIHKDKDAEELVRKAIQTRGCIVEVSARGYTLTIETPRGRIERCLAQAERGGT
jgi:hypothetical protein